MLSILLQAGKLYLTEPQLATTAPALARNGLQAGNGVLQKLYYIFCEKMATWSGNSLWSNEGASRNAPVTRRIRVRNSTTASFRSRNGQTSAKPDPLYG
jgi:hypothetical protein